MKTICMLFVISLMFLSGFIVPLFASGHTCGTIPNETSRFWKPFEKLIQTDVGNQWVNHSLERNYYALETETTPDSIVYHYFDETLGWIPGNIDYFTYDVTRQYVTEIRSNWIMLGESIPISRGIFAYDNGNHLMEASIQIISGIDRQWTDVKRTHIIYQYGGRSLFQIISWSAEEVDYPPVFTKSEFMFDTQGRIITQSEYTSEDSTNWTQTYITNYQYHPHDITNAVSLVSMISKKLPLTMFCGEPMQIGMLSEQIKQIWLFSYWRNDQRDLYTYDNHDRLDIHNQYVCDMTGDWQNNLINTLVYDINGNLLTDLQQEWNLEENTWQNKTLCTYSWSQSTAIDDNTIPKPSDIAVDVNPNPFRGSPEILISSKSNAPINIEIYNCKGQRLYQEQISHPQKISALRKTISEKMKSSGIYFIKASQGYATTCKKVVRLN